jgi:hypothetical protein
MTNPDSDDALLRSSFAEFRELVPGPPPDRLATAQTAARRRRHIGVVAASALAVALVVTPAALLLGGGPADSPQTAYGNTGTDSQKPGPGTVDAPHDNAAPEPWTDVHGKRADACTPGSAVDGVDLAVSSSDITVGPVTQNRRRADSIVTICNLGKATAPAGTLTVRWAGHISADPIGVGSWTGCQASANETGFHTVACTYPTLEPGAAKQRYLTFEMPGDTDPRFGEPDGQYLQIPEDGDVNAGNNRATFGIRKAEPAGPGGQPQALPCGAKSSAREADLAVAAGTLTLGPIFDRGVRRGDLAVHLCNNGKAPAQAGKLTLRWADHIPPDEMGAGSWTGCRAGKQEQKGAVTYNVAHCDHPRLAPGESREYTLTFEMPGDTDPGVGKPFDQYVQVSDDIPGNNRATFGIATVE